MDTNEEVTADTINSGGEGEETVTISKRDYEKLNQDFGSLKREYKDLKKTSEKPKEEIKETSKTNQPDDNRLLERLENMSLRQAGITHKDDMDLARSLSKKWNVDIDELVLDEDFQVKLEKQQRQRANLEATSGVKGGSGNSQAKFSPEYWIAKGTPPSREDVPDRKVRAKIQRAFLETTKNTKKFYND